MKQKRMLAVLLAVAMAFSCLAGCGKTEEKSDDKQENSKEQADVEAKTEDGDELKTIKILSYESSSVDVLGKPYYLSDWVEGDSKMWDKLTSDLAERGLKLELDLIPQDQWETVLQTKIVEGLDKYDIVNIRDMDESTRRDLVNNGTFVAVNEIVDQYSDGTAKEFMTSGDTGYLYSLNAYEDGNNYFICYIAICDYMGSRDIGSLQGLQIRQDWLDKLGLEMPKTSDDLYDVLCAFRDNDVNENGAPDEITNSFFSIFANGYAQMFGLIPDLIGLEPGTEKMTSVYYQDGIKDYFTYMNKLYNEGLLDLSNQSAENMADNKIGVWYDWFEATWHEPTIQVPEGAAVPQFVGMALTAKEGETPLLNGNIGALSGENSHAVTSSADPEAIAALLDYLCTDEYITFAEYGIEGFSYDMVDGKMVRKNVEGSEDREQVLMSTHCSLFTDRIFPRVEMVDYEQVIQSVQDVGKSQGYPENGYAEKAGAIKNVYDNMDDHKLVMQSPNCQVAIATEEETERYSELYTDLETYFEELNLKLIMGEKSIDDMDTYIAEMQRLGLDELIDIYQARYDRLK